MDNVSRIIHKFTVHNSEHCTVKCISSIEFGVSSNIVNSTFAKSDFRLLLVIILLSMRVSNCTPALHHSM